MAGLAAQRLAGSANRGHAVGKLAFVNVLMATCATKRAEMIDSGLRTGRRLVALIACYGDMPVGKRETGLLVLGQRVAGGLECEAVVALLTTIAPGFADKLALVFVLVAVHAKRKLDSVTCFLSRRNVAIGAFDFFVRRHERKLCLSVIRC